MTNHAPITEDIKVPIAGKREALLHMRIHSPAAAEPSAVALLLPGFSMNGASYQFLCRRLTEAGIRLVVADMFAPGSGVQPGRFVEDKIAQLQEAALGFAAARFGPVVVISHSIGGRSAASLCAEVDSRIVRHVTVAPALHLRPALRRIAFLFGWIVAPAMMLLPGSIARWMVTEAFNYLLGRSAFDAVRVIVRDLWATRPDRVRMARIGVNLLRTAGSMPFPPPKHPTLCVWPLSDNVAEDDPLPPNTHILGNVVVITVPGGHWPVGESFARSVLHFVMAPVPSPDAME